MQHNRPVSQKSRQKLQYCTVHAIYNTESRIARLYFEYQIWFLYKKDVYIQIFIVKCATDQLYGIKLAPSPDLKTKSYEKLYTRLFYFPSINLLSLTDYPFTRSYLDLNFFLLVHKSISVATLPTYYHRFFTTHPTWCL